MTTRRAFLESLGLALGVGVAVRAARRPERVVVDLTEAIPSFGGPGPITTYSGGPFANSSLTYEDCATALRKCYGPAYLRGPFTRTVPFWADHTELTRHIATTSQRVRP